MEVYYSNKFHLPFSVRLDDGQWNQVVIDNADGYMKVIVNTDNEPARNSYKKLSLQDYTQHPFIDGKIVVDMVDSFLVYSTL